MSHFRSTFQNSSFTHFTKPGGRSRSLLPFRSPFAVSVAVTLDRSKYTQSGVRVASARARPLSVLRPAARGGAPGSAYRSACLPLALLLQCSACAASTPARCLCANTARAPAPALITPAASVIVGGRDG